MRLARLVLACVAAVSAAGAETVRVDLNGATTPIPPELRPGFFYNNTTSEANAIFDTCDITCNLIRCGDISYYIRVSTSYADVMSHVRSLRSLYQHRAGLTDRFVIEISGMPYWLSRSQDTTPTGSGWRYFQTVGPRDYALFDSMMRGIATEIRTWGFQRWYETWNEPDLHSFWNGTEAELVGLYRHAANAIREADPNAKVGGFAVNFWYKGIDANMPATYGWIPDSLIRRYAATAHLIDSCALAGTPLDFVSWHTFAPYPGLVDQAADFFRRQLDSAGLFATELLMTEYSISGSLREKPVQPGLMVRFCERMAARGVRHSVASYQDFTTDPTREFFGDYGMLSRGALCKPAFKALQLLNEVTTLGRLLPVELQTDCRLTVLAARQGLRVRVLLANNFLPPLSDGYDALLWSNDHRISTIDLYNAGYTTWPQIDSTVMGIYPPHGPPEVIAAFEAANAAYLWAVQYYYTPRSVELRFTGLADTARGATTVLDTLTNNVIHRYDSLLGAGWTRSAAVSYLYSNQDITRDSLVVPDSVFSIELTPNAVVLLELRGVQTVGVGSPAAAPAGPRLKPMATVVRGVLHLRPSPSPLPVEGESGMREWSLLDATGRKVMALRPGANDVSRLAPGVYFVRPASGVLRDASSVARVIITR